MKPTSEEKRIIRDCAKKSSGHKGILMCPGLRYNLGRDDKPRHLNIALVSDDPDWNDTDLWDNSYSWKDFTKGVELTSDGRGIFDFYVYSLGEYGELETNVTVYYEGGRLARVEGTCDGIMWRRT